MTSGIDVQSPLISTLRGSGVPCLRDLSDCTESKFGGKAEILHSLKPHVAWRLIRRCIDTIENLEKFIFLINFSLLMGQNYCSL